MIYSLQSFEAALDLASRNDGYMMDVSDPILDALRRSGLVYTQPAGDGYVIVKAVLVHVPRNYAHGSRYRPRVVGAEIGVGAI